MLVLVERDDEVLQHQLEVRREFQPRILLECRKRIGLLHTLARLWLSNSLRRSYRHDHHQLECGKKEL